MTNVSHQTLFSLKNYFRNLNIFQETSDSNEPVNEQQQRSNVIATRVYFITLIFVLTFLGIYLSLTSKIIIVTVEYPDQEQYKTLPPDAQCVCSHISVPYGKFTSLQPIQHQVCSSDFVTNRWISALFTGSNLTYFSLQDFRGFASAQFEALSAFCSLCSATVQQAIDSFGQNTFISSQLLSSTALEPQIESAIAQFQQTAPQIFKAQLELVTRVTASNKLVSGLQTNYIITFHDYPQVDVASYRIQSGGCDCLLDQSCASGAVFDTIFGAPSRYETKEPVAVPGISSGCLPVTSILASTLQCFYNQTCVDYLISFFPTTTNFPAMILNNKTRFSPQTTVQTIVDELMVEDWIIEMSYDKYYDECAPSVCTYSKQTRNDMLFVLTKLIGLLSGVVLVLGLVIPMIVDFILKKLRREQSSTVPLRTWLQEVKMKVLKIIVELNVFKQHQSSDREILYQRYATRLYLFLMIIAVGLFVQYNLISTTVHRETILNPSESVYRELEQTYSSGVSCPCSSISIPYSKFITIQPIYHQLCSSYLISSTWTRYTSSRSYEASYILDYRIMSNSQFQTLAMLCEQAKRTINDSLDIFLQTNMVSSEVIPQLSLESEMNARIEDWKSSIINQFNRTIRLISTTALTNQLMNRLNIYFHTDIMNRNMSIEPRHYEECNCAFSGTCKNPMSIYVYDDMDQRSIAYTVPNFYLGCFLFDVLLLSTLECFYNESCMMGLDRYLDSSLRQSLIFPALDANMNMPREKVQSIVDRLMVESWPSDVLYSTYYTECAPKSCKVEYNGLNTFIVVITIVLGICGGLSIGFKMIILVVLRLIEKFSDPNFSLTISCDSIKRFLSRGNEKTLTNRLHFVLVITTLSVLYVSFTVTPELVIVETKTPSFEVYEGLVRDYGDSLQCFCSEISIKYQTFVNITPTFHPVCSRNFVSELWAALLIGDNVYYRNVSISYVYAGVGQVTAIGSFCTLCKETVYNSLSQLLSSHMITAELFPSSSLSQRIQTTINDHRITMPKLFINTLSLIRKTTVANKFMTSYSTNWIFSVPPNAALGNAAHTIPVEYRGCNCALSSDCMIDMFGLKIGCYIVEAFFQSTLECFYNQGCLDRSNRVRPLNATANPSRFLLNLTVDAIINELMIETLTHDLSYEKYFSQCAPSSCFHSYVGKSSLIDGLTILISLYGGLVIICRLIAVIIVKLSGYRSTEVNPAGNEWNN